MVFDPSRHSYVPEVNARKAKRAAADAKLKRVLRGLRQPPTDRMYDQGERVWNDALDAVRRKWGADK